MRAFHEDCDTELINGYCPECGFNVDMQSIYLKDTTGLDQKETPPIIFLDCDGVLNDHSKFPNGYSGISTRNAANLNLILTQVPEAKIVVSSAWRYITSDPKVFEFILLISGVNAHDKVIGATHLDERYIDKRPNMSDVEAWYKIGLDIRPRQIHDWILAHKVKSYVVLDDLPLQIDHFVHTDGSRGLSIENANEAVKILRQ